MSLPEKSNLQIQYNAYQIPDIVFYKLKKKIRPKIHMESQGTPNSQNNLEKKEQIWRFHIS